MSNNAETVIRDLVAYGDTLNPPVPALTLLLGFADCALPIDQAAKVRTILETEFDFVTDSLIDELIEKIDNDSDDWNE